MSNQHTTFPTDLPIPTDDGATSHLPNLPLPSLSLPSTSGSEINLSHLSGLTILFFYPRSGAPGETVSPQWNAIPGARGCTPQVCSYRDASDELLRHGVNHVFGCSTQSTSYQRELKSRTQIPFQLLSDEKGELRRELRLPTLEWEGRVLIKRVTVAIEDGRIEKVWYPVFPPDKNAESVLEWLKIGRSGRKGLSTGTEEEGLANFREK